HLIDVKYTYYGDLRNRVVGARLMAEKIEPYFFKWNPSLPVTLYDPSDIANIKNNLITSPPSLLLLIEPLVRLNYVDICYVWVALHYLFFLAMLVPMYLIVKNADSKYFVVAAAILLLLTDYWNDSVFRGQSHFIFPAIIANIFLLTSGRWKWRFLFSGLLLAFLFWVQPNALLILPFLFFSSDVNRYQLFGGLAAGILSFVLLTLILDQGSYWADFYHTGREWVKNNSSGMKFVGTSFPGADTERQLIPHAPLPWRSQIGDIHTLAYSLFHVNIKSFYLFGLFFVTYFICFCACLVKPAQYFKEAILMGILLYWFQETTAPILKMSYYFVEIFVIVLFFAGIFKELNLTCKLLLISSFLFAFSRFIPMNLLDGELCTIACLFCFLYSAYFKGRKKLVESKNF
ncbi:MAG: hypothetical protein ABI091_16395, partial [Ferruginibacter sp.]